MANPGLQAAGTLVNPRDKYVSRKPARRLHHKQLYSLDLPHRRLTHIVHGPNATSLELSPAGCEAPPPDADKAFVKSYGEIMEKHFLCRDIKVLMDSVVRGLNKIPPYKFIVKYAPLHALEESWKPADKNTLWHTSPAVSARPTVSAVTKTDKPTQPATRGARQRENQRRSNFEAAQLNKLKAFLIDHSLDDLNIIRLATPVETVFEFTRGFLVEILDRKLVFGNNYNQKVFYRHLLRYLKLGIFDKLPVGLLVSEMSLKEIPWLKRVTPGNEDQVAAEFFMWIFADVVNIGVNRIFYATETQFLKNEVLFFRREIWYVLWKRLTVDYQKKGFWQEIPKHSRELRDGQSRLEAADHLAYTYRARMFPRAHGVRPIMMAVQRWQHDMNSFERQMRSKYASLVLKHLMDRYAVWGFGLSAVNQLQNRWTTFRQQRLQLKDTRPLYFITCDVEKAYDSVDLKRLKLLLEELFRCADRQGIKFLFIYDLKQAAHEKKQKEPAAPRPADWSRYKIISKLEYDRQIDGRKDQGEPACISLRTVLEDLLLYLRPTIFQAPDWKLFMLKEGLPQGGFLSALLLGLYLGHLENELKFTVLKDELLVRWMDDLLYITPYLERGQKYRQVVVRGAPGIGFAASVGKTHTNLPDSSASQNLPQCSHRGVTSLHWFGWDIDLATLSIKIDMCRYFACNLRYAVSLDHADENRLSRSLKATATGKFAPLLFSSSCCSRDNIMQNVYQLYLLCGMELLAYWRQAAGLVRYQHRVLYLLCYVMGQLGRMIEGRLKAGQSGIDRNQMVALGWQAFAAVLSQDSSSRPLRERCRRRVRHLAMLALWKVVNNDTEAGRWLIGFLEQTEKRCPVEMLAVLSQSK